MAVNRATATRVTQIRAGDSNLNHQHNVPNTTGASVTNGWEIGINSVLGLGHGGKGGQRQGEGEAEGEVHAWS